MGAVAKLTRQKGKKPKLMSKLTDGPEYVVVAQSGFLFGPDPEGGLPYER